MATTGLVIEASPASPSTRLPAAVWIIAAVFVAGELALSGRYGFLTDELYFIEAGRHLAFGYVDMPPLAPLMTLVTKLLGVHPTVVRIVPAFAGGAVVIMTARIAAIFGARRFGRVFAALLAGCSPLVLSLAHLGITEVYDLAAWAAVLLLVTTAVLRDRPRLWLAAGVAAGLGLQANNVMILLLIGLAIGLAFSSHRRILAARWPWLGSAIAALIWVPNVIWQARHGWPQLTMAQFLHQSGSRPILYLIGTFGQATYAGLFVAPFVVVGFIHLWRTPRLRFLAVTASLLVVFVVIWVPAKGYYSEGTAPVVLAAGAVAAERWVGRGRRHRVRRGLALAAPLLTLVITVPRSLPLLPVSELHRVASLNSVTTTDTVGWPGFTQAVADQAAALTRSGQPPTAVFTRGYGEAAALQVLGAHDHLPPVLSGNNAYANWGPGTASDQTVIVVDALGELRPYFGRCRLLTVYHPPDQVKSDFSSLPIGVCSRPTGTWRTLWPHLVHYD